MARGVCLIGPGGTGGIQTYSRLAASELSARGLHAIRLDPRGPAGGSSPLWTLAAAGRLILMSAGGRIDVAHLMMSERGSVWRKGALAMLARALGLRVVLHHHGADAVRELPRAGRLFRTWHRLTVRSAHLNLVLGRDWAEMLAAEGVARERIMVLRNALPDAAAPPRGSREGPLRVLFLGVMTSRKGARAVVQALAMLRSRGVETEAVLAGDGPDRRAAIQEAASRGVAASFPGAVRAEEAGRLMAWADVLAHPSAREGLPMTILEAMRAALPVIAAPVGAIGEALPNGHGLIHAAPRDAGALARALEGLALNPEARLALGAAGRRAFEAGFRLEAHVDRLEEAYGWTAGEGADAPVPA